MKITLTQDFPFLHKRDLKVVEIKDLGGRYELEGPGFKQSLKASEYQRLLDSQVKVEDAQVQSPQASASVQEEEVVDNEPEQEEAETKSKKKTAKRK